MFGNFQLLEPSFINWQNSSPNYRLRWEARTGISSLFAQYLRSHHFGIFFIRLSALILRVKAIIHPPKYRWNP